jgi:hypothetical protein
MTKKGINIPDCMKFVCNTIGNNKAENKTQDPDRIEINKQWSEFGQFKGYWIDVYYNKKDRYSSLVISFDITSGYTRVMGDLEKIPLYTKGTHNFA